MPHGIEELRGHLFDTLAALRNTEKPMDLDRAREVANVARVLVDSAKVEVDFLKVTASQRGTGFIPTPEIQVPRRQALPPAAPRRDAGDSIPFDNGVGTTADPKGTTEGKVRRRCQACSQITLTDPCSHCGAANAA